jgi:hypothetical protein
MVLGIGAVIAGGLLFLVIRAAPENILEPGGAAIQLAQTEVPTIDSINLPPAPAIPSQQQTTVMVRSAILALDQAMRTGNFTVLRDLGSARFRDRNSAAQLVLTFAKQGAAVNLLPAAILEPKLTAPPAINKDGLLVIEGVFDIGQPGAFTFGLAYETVGQDWRLFEISVGPVNRPVARRP